jgi:hypothetical protein
MNPWTRRAKRQRRKRSHPKKVWVLVTGFNPWQGRIVGIGKKPRRLTTKRPPPAP